MLHFEDGTTVAYAGGYTEFVRQRAERRLAQERAFVRQERSLAAEEDFIRRNIAGSNSAQAKGRRRRLERVQRLSPPPGEEGAMALRLTAEERGSDQVLVAEDVSLAVGERTLLRDFDARLMRGDVVDAEGQTGRADGQEELHLDAFAGSHPHLPLHPAMVLQAALDRLVREFAAVERIDELTATQRVEQLLSA